MTITRDSSAPLVAVVGATGTQGGSVVRALAGSNKPYRVRAFTRDAAKPSAQNLVKLGVDVVVVSLIVENKDEVYKAFAGADFAFLVTNFFEHFSKEREISEGKLLIDAAKAGGASRIVWSGLPSVTKMSGGKYVNVYQFDDKAAVTEYGRQSGVPLVDIQAGFFGTNFLSNPLMFAKQDDGSFAIPLPIKPTAIVPFLDAQHDYGLFVRHVLELPVFPGGTEITAYSEKLTIEEMAQQFAKATGKNIVFKQIPIEQITQGLQALGMPPHIALCTIEALQSWDEFGYVNDLPPHEGLPPLSTWTEFAKKTDWSKTLA
ncbi:hypothetical protein B0H19DRAFT_1232873 [Mycena capillaripes]|nr:hypothetical protein B0H19DRAFT_1232873 [Mycena capillaripes]